VSADPNFRGIGTYFASVFFVLIVPVIEHVLSSAYIYSEPWIMDVNMRVKCNVKPWHVGTTIFQNSTYSFGMKNLMKTSTNFMKSLINSTHSSTCFLS
jgi:cellulose synthase/poly-beta-1,6-N-acetylglucosamine synthase-like glycosyltransferase